jgi:Cu/Ag efflux protein CusF
MTLIHKVARSAAVALFLGASACSGTGGLGNILGSVLGQGQQQGGQVTGYIQSVDTRSQQVYLQQQNGQTLALGYDNNTQVVYQNQRYNVTNLERGDQVTARVQSTSNGGYYTDYVQVDQSVATGSTQNNVQTLQGTVRGVDQNNGLFTIDLQTGNRVTVQLGSQLSRADIDRFRALRSGDYARFYGVYLGQARAELRQFY